MKLSHFSSILFAILLVVSARAQSTDARARTASISGRVTVSGAPAVNIAVIAEELGAGPSSDAKVLPNGSVQIRAHAKTRTDAEGRYRITGLPAGNYAVAPLMRAYTLPRDSRERAPERFVALDEGESRDNADFNLVRGAVITGRVTDAEGRPMIASGVYVLAIDEKGEPRELPYFGSWEWETDDRGIYRLYGLPAGRYWVAAGGDPQSSQVAKRVPTTFYPDALDRAHAKAVVVKEGEIADTIDIRLGASRNTYEARGRVIDAETGRPVPGASLDCHMIRGDDNALELPSRDGVANAQGEFRIAGLASGQYALLLRSGREEGSQGYYSRAVNFTVSDADADGLEVQALRGGTVSGTVTPLGAVPESDKAKLQQAVLWMTVSPSESGESGPRANLNVRVSADGSFRATGLPPGKLKIDFIGYGQIPFTMSHIERDGVRLTEPFEIRPPERIGNVRVVVEYGIGTLRGQVRATGGALPSRGPLGVIVRRKEEASGSVAQTSPGRYAGVDEKGRFQLDQLPPGTYELRLNVTTRMPTESKSEEIAQQTVTITNGAETTVLFSVDLSRWKWEKPQ